MLKIYNIQLDYEGVEKVMILTGKPEGGGQARPLKVANLSGRLILILLNCRQLYYF